MSGRILEGRSIAARRREELTGASPPDRGVGPPGGLAIVRFADTGPEVHRAEPRSGGQRHRRAPSDVRRRTTWT